MALFTRTRGKEVVKSPRWLDKNGIDGWVKKASMVGWKGIGRLMNKTTVVMAGVIGMDEKVVVDRQCDGG